MSNKRSNNKVVGFNILKSKALNRERSKIIQSEIKNHKPVNIREEGNLVSIKTVSGKNDLGMVLSYCPNDLLINYCKSHEIDYDESIDIWNKDYTILGSYKKSEIDEKVRSNSDERPTLMILIVEVINDYQYKVVVNNDNNDQIKLLLNTVKSIAGLDESVSDRINELLKVSVINCISGGMSETYRHNMNTIDHQLEEIDDVDPDNQDI